MNFELVTPPSEEPVLRSRLKKSLQVEHNDDDAWLDDLLKEAREEIEEDYERQLVTATWRLYLPAFPHCGGPIEIRKPPVRTIEAITYVGTDGITKTLDSDIYLLDAKSVDGPGFVHLLPGKAWAPTRNQANAVTVEFTAGYGTADDVPHRAKRLIQLVVAREYDGRDVTKDMDRIARGFRWTL